MRNIKLIVFDLDGTVLDDRNVITPRTARALERAKSSGCTVVISTGRTASMVPSGIKNQPFIDYIITSNGSCIQRVKDGTILQHLFLGKQTALEIYSEAKRKNAAFNVFFEDCAVFEIRSFSYMLAGLKRFSWKNYKQINELRKNVHHLFSVERMLQSRNSRIEKMGCNFKRCDDCEDILDTLRKRGDINVVRTLNNELEITACGVSKGDSLATLCKLLDIDSDMVVAFGDSGNDKSMKEYAGCFVAVGNATPEVKAVADFVTGTVSEDGVAQWLEQHLEV